MTEQLRHPGSASASTVCVPKISSAQVGSGRVVCAAALIMTAVFAGFIPADDPIIKSIAFALTTGVLIDAFVVRLTLIPAAMTLLGLPAWQLPARLDRVLPHADIEGASLPSPARPANPEQVPAT